VTIEQTIDIPANREVHIHLVVPDTVPCGRTNVILEFPQGPDTIEKPNVFDEAARLNGYKDHADYLRANTPATIEEAIAQAQAKLADPEHKNFFKKYYGCLAGEDVYSDGMEYQRKMRDEWSHRP
jgi:hypothetical protein